MKTATPLLTIQEVAIRLAVSDRHVRKLVAGKQLSAIKLGRSVRFDPDVLEREIQAMTRRSLTLEVAGTNHRPLK